MNTPILQGVAMLVITLASHSLGRAATTEDIAHSAEGYLGVPYNWGGTSSEGFDCSGFVGKVYAENGYVLPRVSRQQAHVGLVVPEFALQKGDLLFFTGTPEHGPINHVGLYMQDGTFIHASVGGNGVRFDHLQSRYFQHRFAGARRILGLPPGRYATLAGTAPEGVLFNDASEQSRFTKLSAIERANVIGATPGAGSPLLVEGEHDDASRPIQIAAEPPVAMAITEVGPTRLDHARTGIALQGGYLLLDGDNFAVLQPVVRYVGEASSIRVDVAVPWAVPWNSQGKNPLAWGPWDAARTWGRAIRTLAIGQQNANLEARVDRTWSATLGSGQLMRYLTPNIGTAGLADAAVEKSALSFAGSTTLSAFGGQWFVDDVFSPAVLGARLWLGPSRGSVQSHGLWGATRLSLSWAADLFAPYRNASLGSLSNRQVHGLGVTWETPWYKSARQMVSTVIDAATLMHPGARGWGMAGAMTYEGQGIGKSALRGRLRLEGRASQGAFVPTYFDVFYPASRALAPVQPGPIEADAPTRLDWLESLDGAPWHWSLAAEGHLQLFHRATVGVAYEDGEALASALGDYSPRSFMFFLRLDPLFESPSGETSSLYVAYHLRNAASWTHAGWHGYAYVAARHDLNRFLGLHVALRHGLQTQTQTVQTDVMGALSISFDL